MLQSDSPDADMQSASDALAIVFKVSEQPREFLADFLDCFIELVASQEKPKLRRRGMFRAKTSVSYMTYTLCLILQQVSDFDIYL